MTGHATIGPGHPDKKGGAAPLPGLEKQASKRMMVSGDSGLVTQDSKMLTKAEWDEIEKWLNANIPDEEE